MAERVTAKLYVLTRSGKKEKGSFGEVEVVMISKPMDGTGSEKIVAPGGWVGGREGG